MIEKTYNLEPYLDPFWAYVMPQLPIPSFRTRDDFEGQLKKNHVKQLVKGVAENIFFENIYIYFFYSFPNLVSFFSMLKI